jgi:hypothetical protein
MKLFYEKKEKTLEELNGAIAEMGSNLAIQKVAKIWSMNENI